MEPSRGKRKTQAHRVYVPAKRMISFCSVEGIYDKAGAASMPEGLLLCTEMTGISRAMFHIKWPIWQGSRGVDR